MKKLIALGAAAVLAVTLVGCSGGGEDKPSSGDPSVSEPAAGANEPAKENKLAIVETGWSAENDYIHYGAIIENQGGQAALFPTIKVTGKDASGNVVSSDEQTLMIIYPGQKLAWGGQAGNGTAPDSVDFEVSTKSSNWIDGDPVDQQYELTGVSAQDNGYGMIDFVGEIKNLTDADVDSVCVNVLLRDAGGAIVAGYSGYVDNLAAGATTSFEVMGYDVPEYATIEAWGQSWSMPKL